MQKMIKKLLGVICFMACLVLVSCPSDSCTEYQDAVVVGIMTPMRSNLELDSVAIKTNDSIIACGERLFQMLGSKTHNIKFPVNLQIQLFAHKEEFKKLPFEMQKNTILKFYTMEDCQFLNDMEQAEKDKLVDYQLLNDESYCWIVEKMGKDNYSRCVEYYIQGKIEACPFVEIN